MNSPLLGAVLVEALLACGVTDFVLAPGSRNSAVSLALHEAEVAGRLRLHVRVDERVAAFTALGLAKASQAVTAVVTTSGSAVGNLLPAAMEARAAGVGIVFVTTDRPAELVGTGASQTTEQVGALSPAVHRTIRISSTANNERGWAAAVSRAMAIAAGARTRQPGPVQLNVEFTEPLISTVPKAAVSVPTIHHSRPSAPVQLAAGPRTVVLVGDATPEVGAQARAVAEAAGVPLLAEPTSNARAGECASQHYRLLLGSLLGRDIERVICYGHPTLSRPVSQLLGRNQLELIVVTDQAEWSDAGHGATQVVDAVELAAGEPDWLRRWQEADATLAQRRETSWGGLQLAETVVTSLGSEHNLVLGASMIIRDADLAAIAECPPVCYANRGLAGIDGTIATATGIALATGRPTTVLLGDLTLQHDLGALVAVPGEAQPDLRIVVSDDSGGAIFSLLEQGAPEYGAAFERVFATPQQIDLASVAESLGWAVSVVTDDAELRAALRAPMSGRSVIVAKVDRATRRAAAAALRRLGKQL